MSLNEHGRVTLGTENVDAYFQDTGLRGCFAGFRTCKPAGGKKRNAVEPPYFAFTTFLIERDWTTEEVCIYISTMKQECWYTFDRFLF